jgi:hypothetical protein
MTDQYRSPAARSANRAPEQFCWAAKTDSVHSPLSPSCVRPSLAERQSSDRRARCALCGPHQERAIERWPRWPETDQSPILRRPTGSGEAAHVIQRAMEQAQAARQDPERNDRCAAAATAILCGLVRARNRPIARPSMKGISSKLLTTARSMLCRLSCQPPAPVAVRCLAAFRWPANHAQEPSFDELLFALCLQNALAKGRNPSHGCEAEI